MINTVKQRARALTEQSRSNKAIATMREAHESELAEAYVLGAKMVAADMLSRLQTIKANQNNGNLSDEHFRSFVASWSEVLDEDLKPVTEA